MESERNLEPAPDLMPAQLPLFEGQEITRHRFTLRVGPDLDTEEELRWGKRVRGTFSGIITEVGFKMKRDASTVRVHVIEVDEAELHG